MRLLAAGLSGALALLWLTSPAFAEPPRAEFRLKESLALGMAEHRLDHRTELVGWRLNASWYLGHKDGKDGEKDEALSLIWQGERRQMSISTDGIRFTRRF